MSSENSVTLWLHALRRGDEKSASELWDRYFHRLMSFARRRMGGMPTTTYDEEDAAVSTFRVLCDKLKGGAYPNLSDRDELWRLMLTVAIHKINRRHAYETAEKRRNTNHPNVIQLADARPVTGEMANEYEDLIAKLGDPNLEQVVIWKLEGYTNEEIALKLNRTRRTVQRMLELIRAVWKSELELD